MRSPDNPKSRVYYKVLSKEGTNFHLENYDNVLQGDNVAFIYGEAEIATGIIISKTKTFREEGIRVACYKKEGWSERIGDKAVMIVK